MPVPVFDLFGAESRLESCVPMQSMKFGITDGLRIGTRSAIVHCPNGWNGAYVC